MENKKPLSQSVGPMLRDLPLANLFRAFSMNTPVENAPDLATARRTYTAANQLAEAARS